MASLTVENLAAAEMVDFWAVWRRFYCCFRSGGCRGRGYQSDGKSSAGKGDSANGKALPPAAGESTEACQGPVKSGHIYLFIVTFVMNLTI